MRRILIASTLVGALPVMAAWTSATAHASKDTQAKATATVKGEAATDSNAPGATAQTGAARIMAALRLPTVASDARKAGLADADIKVVIDTSKEMRVDAVSTRMLLDAGAKKARSGAKVENYGAHVRSLLKSGKRGRALAVELYANGGSGAAGEGDSGSKDHPHGKFAGDGANPNPKGKHGKFAAGEQHPGKGVGQGKHGHAGKHKGHDKGDHTKKHGQGHMKHAGTHHAGKHDEAKHQEKHANGKGKGKGKGQGKNND